MISKKTLAITAIVSVAVVMGISAVVPMIPQADATITCQGQYSEDSKTDCVLQAIAESLHRNGDRLTNLQLPPNATLEAREQLQGIGYLVTFAADRIVCISQTMEGEICKNANDLPGQP